MISIKKQWPLPKGIKQFIWDNTDFQTNMTQRTSRFVSCIEMYDGKPIKRVFGFLSASQFRTFEDIKVKEVARYYDHKMYLGFVSCNIYTGNKKVYYDCHPDRFDVYKGDWWFSCYPMTDPEKFLEENGFKYTGWNKGCGMEFHEYLTRYIENPKIELLAKAGLGKWAGYTRYLDTSKKSLHEVFKIKPNCTPLLYEEDFGLQELFMCRRTGCADYRIIRAKVALDNLRKDLLRRYNQNFTKDDAIIEILNREKTAEYCAKRHTYYFCNDYIDYLKDLAKIGAINDPKAIYPSNFQQAHEEVSKQVKIAKSKELMDGFAKQYEAFIKLAFANGSYLIRPVKNPLELYVESDILHHCVRSYDQNVAAGTTEILFIRREEEPDTPFYTLELKDKKIVQVRGEHNKDPEESVTDFVKVWAKKFKLNYTGTQPHYAYY